MKTWLIFALAYLVVAIGCYVAICVFFPQLLTGAEHAARFPRAVADSVQDKKKRGSKLMEYGATFIGLPVGIILAPLVLLICVWSHTKKKHDEAS